MKKRGSERGISPLIATVLIIGFVVMVAAVLFIWGGKFTIETIARQEYKIGTALQCGQVDFKITVPDPKEETCMPISLDLDGDGIKETDASYLAKEVDKTKFENKGQVPIIDFYVRVHSEQFPVITIVLGQFMDQEFLSGIKETQKRAGAEKLGGIAGQILPLSPLEIKSADGMINLIYIQELALAGSVGAIEKLDLIPITKLESGEEVSCADRLLEVEIPRCSTT